MFYIVFSKDFCPLSKCGKRKPIHFDSHFYVGDNSIQIQFYCKTKENIAVLCLVVETKQPKGGTKICDDIGSTYQDNKNSCKLAIARRLVAGFDLLPTTTETSRNFLGITMRTTGRPSLPAVTFQWFLVLPMAVLLCAQGAFSARPESLSHNELQASQSLLRGHVNLQRDLKIGDFDEINELLRDVEIRLINETKIGAEGAEVNIKDIYCTHINIGDVQTKYTVTVNATSNQDTLSYTISVHPIEMQCFAKYSYNFGFLLQGSGSFNTFVDKSKVEVRIDFNGTLFDEEPPSHATVQYCKADIHNNGKVMHKADGGDDLIGGAFTLFKEPALALIDATAASIVCEQIEKLGDVMLADILNKTNSVVADWLPPLNASWTDPLMPETQFFRDDPDVVLLDFLNNTSDNDISDLALNLATQYLGTIKTDNKTEGQELGIIKLLEKVLDVNGVFDLPFNRTNITVDREFPFAFDSEVLVGGMLVRLNGVQLIGLDKLTYFDPLVPVGRHTLSNTLAWEQISVQVDFTMDLALYTPDDSILLNVTEDATVSIDFINVNMLLSIFAPINQTEIAGLFLNPAGLFDSLLPVVKKFEISGLNVTVSDMTPPIVYGLMSDGLDRVLSNFSEAMLSAYKPVMLRTIPGIFQGPFRHVLNSMWATFLP